jgi:hypothetical protein
MDSTPQHLQDQQISLRYGNLLLRPMTEDDGPLLVTWNNDPEARNVGYKAQGGVHREHLPVPCCAERLSSR